MCRGRLTEAIESALSGSGGSWTCPPQNLGDRPNRAVLQDMESFLELCDRFDLNEDARITLGDLQERKCGTRIGLVLWDISKSVHEKISSGEIPESVGYYIPPFNESERFGMRQMSPSSWKRSEKFEKASISHVLRNDDNLDEKDGDIVDASAAILTSILSPNRKKPAHSKMMSAILSTNDVVEDNSASSQMPNVVDALEGISGNKTINEKSQIASRKIRNSQTYSSPRKRGHNISSLPWLKNATSIIVSGALLTAVLAVVKLNIPQRRKERYFHDGRW